MPEQGEQLLNSSRSTKDVAVWLENPPVWFEKGESPSSDGSWVEESPSSSDGSWVEENESARPSLILMGRKTTRSDPESEGSPVCRLVPE